MTLLRGIVTYFCPCGFIASARTAYACLLALNDHHKYAHQSDPRD